MPCRILVAILATCLSFMWTGAHEPSSARRDRKDDDILRGGELI